MGARQKCKARLGIARFASDPHPSPPVTPSPKGGRNQKEYAAQLRVLDKILIKYTGSARILLDFSSRWEECWLCAAGGRNSKAGISGVSQILADRECRRKIWLKRRRTVPPAAEEGRLPEASYADPCFALQGSVIKKVVY